LSRQRRDEIFSYFAIMKQILALAVLFLILSCNNSNQQDEEKKSVTDVDAARNFLNASLKGDFNEASVYMLQDSTNSGYLFNTERTYKTMPAEDKRELKEASLHFYEPSQRPNDSTTILIFSNSFKNDKDTLRIVKLQGKWLVDLKYLFTHDSDTLFNKIDTITH
jgi:hypothetical protein